MARPLQRASSRQCCLGLPAPCPTAKGCPAAGAAPARLRGRGMPPAKEKQVEECQGCVSSCTRVGEPGTDFTAETPPWTSPIQESGAGNMAVSPTKMWAEGALPFQSGMALLYHRLKIQAHLLTRAHCVFLFWQLLRGLYLFTCSY